MDINPNAPGNISQKGVNSQADNETGFDPRQPARSETADVADASADPQEDGVDKDLGFDPESPDASDPAVDPVHPARTSNDPVPSSEPPTPEPDQPSPSNRGL